MPDLPRDIRLLLLFTRGVSLRTWDHMGMFAREVALYRRLSERGVRVTFVTYGNERDLEYANRIPEINICCNDTGASEPGPDEVPSWLPAEIVRQADLIKTNQTNGADIALRIAQQWDKPMIARCGYMWSDFVARREGEDLAQLNEVLDIEARVFNSAARVVVTTEAMKASVTRRFPALAARTCIVPNYVDTAAFSPAADEPPRDRQLCYVGRLDQQQKNIRSLLAAVRDLDADLQVIGTGPLHARLEHETADSPNVHLLGSLPNDALPKYLRRSSAFILPSFYEGHPKALLEAMACGLPVIAARVPGVAELMRHGETGWLCTPDADSLRTAIRTVLDSRPLAVRLGHNARRHIVEHFALDRVIEQELALYQDILTTVTTGV